MCVSCQVLSTDVSQKDNDNINTQKTNIREMAGGVGKKDVLLCNYTHMKCDPSVSCGCVDGAGDNDDSGEEGKLFTASHTAR